MLRLNQLLEEAKRLGTSLAAQNPATMREWHTNMHTTEEARLGRVKSIVVSFAVIRTIFNVKAVKCFDWHC